MAELNGGEDQLRTRIEDILNIHGSIEAAEEEGHENLSSQVREATRELETERAIVYDNVADVAEQIRDIENINGSKQAFESVFREYPEFRDFADTVRSV